MKFIVVAATLLVSIGGEPRPGPTRPTRPGPTRPTRPGPTRPGLTRPTRPGLTRPTRPGLTRPTRPGPTRKRTRFTSEAAADPGKPKTRHSPKTFRRAEDTLSCNMNNTSVGNVTTLKDIAQFNIKCPTNTSLNSFKMAKVKDPNLYTYDFKCCHIRNTGPHKASTERDSPSTLPTGATTSDPLAPQNVNCINNDVMYEFQMLVKNNGADLAYNTGCMTGNNPIKCKAFETLPNGNQVHSLSQQNPTCPTYFGNFYPYLQSFQLVKKSGLVHYNYTCCTFI